MDTSFMKHGNSQFNELKATGKLPSPTGVALRVLEIAQRHDTSIQDIVDVLKSDPALAGKILRLVNSSRFALSRPTANLVHAVSYLGLRTVKQLTLGFSVVASSPRGVCNGFDYNQFWLRSLATAMLSDSLSAKTRRFAPRDDAYTCGLLSQIGRLGFATAYPKEYATLLRDFSLDDPWNLVVAERDKFLMDHNYLTAALLQDWGFPPTLIEGTQHHEQPDHQDLKKGSESSELAHVLHFSEQLADCWLAEPACRSHLIHALIESAQRYQLSAEDLVALVEEGMQDWSEWCSAFELATSTTTTTSLQDSILEFNKARCVDLLNDPIQRRPDVLRIVVVDDDPICLKALQRQLSADGHQIMTARAGREALHLVLETNPQVMITDWVMPEMDGLELCRAIRTSEFGHQLYIIMVTSHQDKHRLTEAFQAGCDDYVTKPVHPVELRARIRAASRGIRLQEQLKREKAEAQQYATELSLGNRKLEHAATTDALTGLPNRRYGLDRLHEIWETAGRTGREVACLIIDVDHFKVINDTYGHPAGDAVLQQMASALYASTRECDIICRLGGEEFLVVCTDIDRVRTKLAAERIQQAIEKTSIQYGRFASSITVSVGAAVSNAQVDNVEGLLKSADEALYEAKHAGRNCVRLAPSCPELTTQEEPG